MCRCGSGLLVRIPEPATDARTVGRPSRSNRVRMGISPVRGAAAGCRRARQPGSGPMPRLPSWRRPVHDSDVARQGWRHVDCCAPNRGAPRRWPPRMYHPGAPRRSARSPDADKGVAKESQLQPSTVAGVPVLPFGRINVLQSGACGQACAEQVGRWPDAASAGRRRRVAAYACAGTSPEQAPEHAVVDGPGQRRCCGVASGNCPALNDLMGQPNFAVVRRQENQLY